MHPQVESYWGNVNPVGPRSVYDEAKRFSEAAVMAYHRYHNVNTHLVRIFNTYGPRLQANDGRVISNLMMQALRGEPLTIYGDGSQTRSFCYVSDLIDGTLRLSKTDEHRAGEYRQSGRVDDSGVREGDPGRLVGIEERNVFEPLPQDDPTRRRPDITQGADAARMGSRRCPCGKGLGMSVEYFKAVGLTADGLG